MLSFSAWPALCALPLPWLVSRWLKPAAPQPEAALRIPFYQQLQQLTHITHNGAHSSRLLAFAYCIWLLLIISAMQPIWLGEAIRTEKAGRDLLVAVDISGSMETQDLLLKKQPASRLSVVKSILSEFIQRRATDRIGLILFGSQAYLQTPLTFDHTTVNKLLNEAEIGLAGPQTAIGDAIGLALKKLKNRPAASRTLILLTDGSNTAGEVSPEQAATIAAQQKLKIYTIGVGAREIIIPGLLGFDDRRVNPSSDLDEKTLTTIAEKTGGYYFRADNTENLKKIYQQLDRLEPSQSKSLFYRPQKELFYWPLGLAFLLSTLLALLKLMPNLMKSISQRGKE